MIVKIICAGKDDFSKLYKKEEGEYIIAVDGGVKAVKNSNIIADLVIGDFDSCDLDINEYSKNYIRKITFDKRKDFSDLELALRECKKIKDEVEKVIIYNATGGRLDHLYANILLLENYNDLKLEITDENNCVFVINKDTVFLKNEYKYISFFALEKETVISLTGFSYNLDNYELELNNPLCLSNEIVEKGIIKVNNKKILVIRSK